MKAGKIEEAIEQYKLALAAQANASVYVNLGKALSQLGKLEEA
ncbi:MAG: tetratricopeptide repeat protein [Gomphosphaeria aponina SAG 52.96 = DSM 107014]|uniref:Tetratricopeptide repeat protein n=1 Tax=Gomphosphaeria aponina SAG 52.96 = DSM 107014 TaxID=1521640 RepID=A0A941GP46_9CHRO|nr:tetratricopeptide repeat protein [Gomphosphaeria aponina SAG 52.96 = DSM 107014]